MSLRSKLFIGIGSLFLIVAVVSFTFPRFFIEKDVDKVRNYFNEEIERQNEKSRSVWQYIFDSSLNSSIKVIDASLLYYSNNESLQNLLKNALDLVQKEKVEIIRTSSKNTKEESSKGYNFLKGSTKEKAIQLTLLLSNDLNIEDFQAAAIVGNFMAEGFYRGYPDVIEGGKRGPPPDWGTQNIGYGWAQWTNTSKEEDNERDRLNKFIKRLGGSSDKPGRQAFDSDNYAYVLHEFLDDYFFNKALKKLRKSKNIEEAVLIIHRDYEISNHPILTRKKSREIFAKKILKNLNEVKEKEPLAINQKIQLSEDEENIFYKTLSEEKPLKSSIKENVDLVIALESSLSGELVRSLYEKILIEISRFNKKAYLNSFVKELIDKNPQVDYIQVSQGKKGFSYADGGTKEESIFFLKPLFNDASYFSLNAKGKNPPDTISVVESDLLKNNYICNTLKIESPDDPLPIYLTFGRSFFEDLTSSLFLNKALIVFLSQDGKFIHAQDEKKQKIKESYFKGLPFEKISDQDSGHFTWDEKSFSYFALQSEVPLPVKTYIIIPDSQQPMYQIKDVINQNMVSVYKMLSSQMLGLSILLLTLALLFIAYFSKRLSNPIILLANATKKIAQGEFEDIKLPLVKDSEAEISVLTKGFSDMIVSLEEREKMRDLLDKVVSKEIAQEILKGKVQLGGENKTVTILFADIRGFTAMTKDLDPKFVLKSLNDYLTQMTDVIEKEGGVIDKFIGDAIMALYGAPVEDPKGAKHAILSAVSMIERLKIINKIRKSRNENEVFIGIGIHTGNVVAGNMGTMKRLNYTVLGAGVNLASRLCSSAGRMEIRVSEDTLKASGIEDILEVEPLGPQVYKGFIEPIRSYSIKGLKLSS